MKKPLARDNFSPRASKVSIATAEGLMRRTSSGSWSCEFPWWVARNKEITPMTARIDLLELTRQTNFMPNQYNARLNVLRGGSAKISIGFIIKGFGGRVRAKDHDPGFGTEVVFLIRSVKTDP